MRTIARCLFEAPGVRDRITRDYGFGKVPDSPESLVAALLGWLGQAPLEDPMDQRPSNQEVFRAAVRSLGSNSRSWATYLKGEPELERLLFGMDPAAVAKAHASGQLQMEQVRSWLPGQSSSGDARAILRWASRLSAGGDFHEELRALGSTFQVLADRHLEGGFQRGELFLCLVGFLGDPPRKWEGRQHLPADLHGRSPEQWKLPGMAYALTSEMLRNLRWDGFKVDRHITRLLGRWVPEIVEACRPRAQALGGLVGTRKRDLLGFLAYALAGMQIAPAGVPRSHVDNLIWALGAYVEKKGKESATPFVR